MRKQHLVAFVVVLASCGTRSSLPLPPIPRPPPATIAMGGTSACAVRSDGTVDCWGGVNCSPRDHAPPSCTCDPVACSLTPAPVAGLVGAVEIALGAEHACVRKVDGSVVCWGAAGLLGDGTINASATPVTVTGIGRAIQIVAGGATTCVLENEGTVQCWGELLGPGGSVISATAPTPVPALANATQIAIDFSGYFFCATIVDGTARCWGAYTYERTGTLANEFRSIPATIDGLSQVESVATSFFTSCARLADGTVRCWGSDGGGAFGDGGSAPSTVPRTISGLTGVTQLSFGLDACVLMRDRTVRCWGSNGDAPTTEPSLVRVPTLVEGLRDASEIAVGYGNYCARTLDGDVSCWGWNNLNGQLGDGTTKGRPSAASVSR